MEIGKIYIITHQRKGQFIGKLVSMDDDDEWSVFDTGTGELTLRNAFFTVEEHPCQD
jgi:hypothetical protein